MCSRLGRNMEVGMASESITYEMDNHAIVPQSVPISVSGLGYCTVTLELICSGVFT